MIHLVKPSINHKAQALQAAHPYREKGDVMHGSFRLVPFLNENSYEAWLTFLDEVEDGSQPGFRPTNTYFVMDDALLVGIINLRYELSEKMLETDGHIGYSIQPQYRGKGYASEALRQALQKMKRKGLQRILLTCDVDNRASARVIEKCGGVLDDIRRDDQGFVKRYWITL